MKLLFYFIDSKRFFIFDNRYIYTLDSKKSIIEIEKNPDFIESFYASNVDLTVLAGQNGSGKTHILNSIYKLKTDVGVFVFEDEDGFKFLGNKNVVLYNDYFHTKENKDTIFIKEISGKKKCVMIEKKDIDIDSIFFSNSLEGKNQVFVESNKYDSYNLSIGKNIYNENYLNFLNKNILKQIKMIKYCKEQNIIFPESFFELPKKISGSLVFVDAPYTINDNLLHKIIFSNNEYEIFNHFCKSFYQDKTTNFQKISQLNNVSLFNSLITYGLDINDVFNVIGEVSNKNEYSKRIWRFLMNCLGYDYAFKYDDKVFNKINNEINKLIEIEKFSITSIEQVNLGTKKTDSLDNSQIELIFKHRNCFKKEFKRIRPSLKNFTEDDFNDLVDTISISEILIFLWKYIILNYILDNVDGIEGNQNIISFEANIDSDETLINLLLLNKANFILEVYWKEISSGENYFLNLFSEIYNYKLMNNSCNNVVLCIDEVDLGLHPEWQRKWVKYSPKIIQSIINSDLEDSDKRMIQIIMSTHSPIMLSDFLSESVHLLKDRVILKEKIKTFGSNIHDLMSNSFFLVDGVIGEFAKNSINNALSDLNEKKEFDKEDEIKIKVLANEIGEPIIQNEVKRLITLKFNNFKKEMSKKDELEILEKQIEKLKKEIENEKNSY